MDSSEETNTNSKFHRKVLTLAERIDVINMAEQNLTSKELAEMFKCGRTQIQNILHHKETILEEWKENPDPNRVRRRTSEFVAAIGAIVHEWVERAWGHSIAINDALIREKAQQAQELLQYAEFKPTARWIERFKTKYKLHGIALKRGVHDQQKSLDLLDIAFDLKHQFLANVSDLITILKYAEFTVNKSSHTYARKRSKRPDGDELPSAKIPRIESSSPSNDASFSPADFLQIQCDESTSPVVIKDDEEKEGFFDYNESAPETSCSFSCDASDVVSVKSEKAERKTGAVSNDSSIKITSAVSLERNRKSQSKLKGYLEALDYLVPLEEFVMLNENFRAIGLINQLEEIFKKAAQGVTSDDEDDD